LAPRITQLAVQARHRLSGALLDFVHPGGGLFVELLLQLAQTPIEELLPLFPKGLDFRFQGLLQVRGAPLRLGKNPISLSLDVPNLFDYVFVHGSLTGMTNARLCSPGFLVVPSRVALLCAGVVG
jgi:hypothetical protein